jgi:imidazolonepropionase-like amidohydrolase
MQGRTIIRGGAIVTGTPAARIENGVVVVENSRIAAAGAAAEFGAIEGDADIIDATGCTVMPGLIDTHIHVFHEAQMRRLSESAAALWGARYVQSALRGGLTTIRDLGCQTDAVFGLKRALDAGWASGPRLLVCGRAICMTGGHGWANLSIEADGEETIRHVTRQQIKAGADVIKVMASGGAGTLTELPTQAQLSVAELRAAVEVAHDAGRPVSAHALATQGIRNAIEAGVDCIEHGVFLDDTCIELMLKRDIALCPTISVYPRIVERGPAGGEADFVVQRSVKIIEPHFASLRRAIAAGLRIVFGTDATTLYNPLGDIGLEMSLMVQAGMTPLDVILSATSRAAELCGLAEDVGTLEPGRHADILIAGGDAVTDVAALGDVRWVLRDGRILHQASNALPWPNMLAELR